jgi:5'-3' exonuclease
MEADDLIGSMITKWQNEADITVISGDKDLLQLLRPSTEIAFTKKGYTEYDIYTHTRFKEEYSIEPAQFAQVKAFMGDTSDGYPGVKGIGPKQALTLIQTYGSIDKILESLGELKPGQRTKIQDHLDMLKLSHELATIQTNVPIEADFASLVLPSYEPQIFKEIEERGYTLIAKHARSLYSLI